MIDVPDLVRVPVIAPIGYSDHSSLLAVNSIAQAIPHLYDSRKVSLIHQVNWNTVCGAMCNGEMWRLWHNICSADSLVAVLNEYLLLLVGCFIPNKVIRVRNNDKPWFDDQCRSAFGLKQDTERIT